MKKDYSKFNEISIYETGLVREKSAIAGKFNKNNIETLEDLFIMDDNVSIDYGRNYISTSSGQSIKNANQLMRGIIKLIRYKYLDEGLYADTLIGKTYTLDQNFFTTNNSTVYSHFSNFLYKNVNGKILDNDFKNLGFNDNEIEIICRFIFGTFGPTFEFSKAFLAASDFMVSNLEEYNQRLFANVAEQSIFLEKIRLISKYIKEELVVTNDKDSEVSLENKESSTEDKNIMSLIEEEKKLIEELNSLNERSSKIASRISEIQELKKNNSNIRR